MRQYRTDRRKGACVMKKYNICKMLAPALPSLVILILPIFAANLLLRNLGAILAIFLPREENAKFDFPLIFEQLRDASILPHIWLPLLCAAGFGFLLFYVSKRVKNQIVISIIAFFAFVVLFLFSFLSSFMLTSVNGIRFCDLLAKLIPLIDKL